MLQRRHLRNLDKSILLAAFAIFLLGVVFLSSATYNMEFEPGKGLVSKQLCWVLIGLVLMSIVMAIDYQRFIDVSYILYGVNVLLLILVIFLGRARFGAQRWFAIGGFNMQPSEFIKFTLILALATYIGDKKTLMDRAENLVVPFLLCAIPFFLVMIQPDLGTGLLLIPTLFAMLYVGGARPRHLVVCGILGVLALPVFWQFLREYQRMRLLVFMNPNIDPLGAGYTITQSKIAIGSGGLIGKGWLSGTQNQLNFLPERHTDFIFSVAGEEWGFLGSLILISLFLIIIVRGFRIASSQNDTNGRLITTGILTLLSLQVFINIAMTIGLMPVVGLPLPLVSYGGSSLATTMASLGLLLNVGMRRSTF